MCLLRRILSQPPIRRGNIPASSKQTKSVTETLSGNSRRPGTIIDPIRVVFISYFCFSGTIVCLCVTLYIYIIYIYIYMYMYTYTAKYTRPPTLVCAEKTGPTMGSRASLHGNRGGGHAAGKTNNPTSVMATTAAPLPPPSPMPPSSPSPPPPVPPSPVPPPTVPPPQLD